jgi:antitoxin MazE
MVKTLTKHGNSWALVIDKAIMELLHIKPESPLEVTTDGKALVIAPVTDDKRGTKFESVLQKTNRKYAKALKRLAE